MSWLLDPDRGPEPSGATQRYATPAACRSSLERAGNRPGGGRRLLGPGTASICGLHRRDNGPPKENKSLTGCPGGVNFFWKATTSRSKQGSKIASTMYNAQNSHVGAHNAVNDHIVADGKASPAAPQVVVARSSQPGMAGKQIKPVGDRIDLVIGGGLMATLRGDVPPNVIQVGTCLRCERMQVQIGTIRLGPVAPWRCVPGPCVSHPRPASAWSSA